MNLKKRAAEYLSFTRRDRIAIISLVIASLLLYLAPFLVPVHFSHTPSIDSSWVASIQKLEQNGREEDRPQNENYIAFQHERSISHYSRSKAELFHFDPNTISVQEWKRLGLRDKTINIILNYRNKGGKFRKKEDLKKIYGLFKDEYERLEPFVQIGNKQYAIGNGQYGEKVFPEKKNPVSIKDLTIYDINAADTTAFIALPGIGSKLASRIILFRDKLGGFYSVDQVGETFGLADSVFQKIKKYLKLENTRVRKININTATPEELKAHPYLRYNIANPVVAYRNEHGSFRAILDLKKVMAVNEEIYKKVSPYLIVD